MILRRSSMKKLRLSDLFHLTGLIIQPLAEMVLKIKSFEKIMNIIVSMFSAMRFDCLVPFLY